MWRRLKSKGINPLNTGLDSPTAQEQNAKQPPLAGSRVVDVRFWKNAKVPHSFLLTRITFQDIRDEPGAEMVKDARVWKTYVKEMDRFDQEMMNGRDSSLDVLLSCVVLRDLDHSLQLMSQALAAIANSQPVSLPVQVTLDTSEFSPPRSAIIVNVLWVLLLSLSVAVSLFAILAKEWCYIFMSGRSGQAYEQARRRQQRWNGIRKWRMKGVLTYLPGALHMALASGDKNAGVFAVGMCVYLWDINTVVALPVIVVSGLAALVYICVTILPAIDPYCLYGSAAAAAPIRTVRALRVAISSLVDYFSHQINRFGCVEIIPLSATGSTFPPGEHTLDHRERDTPMDEVTSQMITWLLTNCEDTHSVDVALQAIAGARHNLACAPLMQCGVLELLAPRLMACIQWDRHRGQYLVKDLTMLPTALTYCRAYSTLMLRDAYTNIWDKARTDLPKDKRLAKSTRSRGEEGRIMQVHLE
ncbi:hypothetical protein FRC12_007072 [Ceratobasidium sp. 428]|nr:hypothetical protein FRC12_007072 [Ceratobasidium sp. 428]